MSIANMKIIDTDPLKRVYILPQKVLWSTEGIGRASGLLENRRNQAFQGAGNITSASTKEGKKAAFLLDFGTELTGGVRFVTGAGSREREMTVRLRFGESVSEAMTPCGQKNATNDHAVRDMSVPVSRLGTYEWGQTAFRFLYIELETPASELDFVSVHALFTYRDIPYQGSFACNDEIVNAIYNTAAYTAHLNMQRHVWDGVKRDRLIWNGDLYWSQKAIRSVFGYQPVVDETMRYITDSIQLPHYPNFMAGEGMIYILVLDEWSFHTGRTDLLEELKGYWVPMLRQLSELVRDAQPHLCKDCFPGNFFYDWTTHGNDEAILAGLHSLLSRALTAGAKICRIIGETELAEQCERKAGLLKVNDNFHYEIKSLASFMYRAGHLSKEEAGRILREGGVKGMSAPQGNGILTAMAETVSVSFALDVMREFYGTMLKAGATTFWEFFEPEWYKEGARIDKVLSEGEYDIHGDNGENCYFGLRNSLCHAWGSGPAGFLAETVLGVSVLEPGCKKIAVRPKLGDLTWAKGTYPTPFGPVKIEAKRDGEAVSTTISGPAEIEIMRD